MIHPMKGISGCCFLFICRFELQLFTFL